MLIISGEHLADMTLNARFAVVVNTTMKGNDALLFCQRLNVSWSVAQLLKDDEVCDQVFRSLRIAIPENAPSV